MYWLLLFLLLILSGAPVTAQESPFVFSHLTEDNGLVDNVVNCFLQDNRGILWIGTYNGFSRFDGSNFYNYKKRKGNNSMVNEVVHKLCEDKKGNIWGATNNGVFRYQPRLDSFTNYPMKVFGKSAHCFNILCDRSGNVWASSGSSVFQYDPSVEKFIEKLALAISPDSSYNYYIAKNGLKEDPSAKGLWIATHVGLFFYDITKHELQGQYNQNGLPLFNRRDVSALATGKNGNFWFFDNTRQEIILFNTTSRRELKKINIKTQMPDANGGTLFEDSEQRLWFSSWSYELLVIDQRNHDKVYKLLHHEDNKRSVAGYFFWDCYEDEDKNIWLATISGISKCNPGSTIYAAWQLPATIPELKNTFIQLAEVDHSDGSTWMITNSALLIRYNPANQQHTTFPLKNAMPRPGGTAPGICKAIRFFNGNTIITTRTGIWQVKKGSNRIEPFQYLPKDFESISFTDMEPVGDSVIYYSSGKEILYWNYKSGSSELMKLPASVDTFGTLKITRIVFTPASQLWMILSNNTIAFINKGKKIEHVNILAEKKPEYGEFFTLDQDKLGNVWVLNKGDGIYRYNPADRSIKKWDVTDGLAGNRIHSLTTDVNGRVWNIIYNKVSVYIPGTGKFYNFKIPYGEINQNYYDHLTRLNNGNILAAINNDIIEFYPNRLLGKPANTTPQISQLTVTGKDISLFDRSTIVLKPDENTIRIRFGALINKDIFPYDIEYKLEGAEKEWAIAGENQEALYNNLNPGNYTFHVRVKGKNSGWQTKEATLSFTIKTPFYKAIWFFITLALLAISTVFFIYRYRLDQKEKFMSLENKAQALQKEKALVMYENLKQQLNPHFLFNSLTSLNSLIEEEPEAATRFLDSLSKTYRYILKSRDTETVALGDEIHFAENYVTLQKTRFDSGFDMRITIPEEYYYRKIVPVTLQNLIENAIKHNVIDAETPLLVNIFIDHDMLVVENNLQRKNFVETSNRQGLANMQSLYQYLSKQPVEIIETGTNFTIKIPLL